MSRHRIPTATRLVAVLATSALLAGCGTFQPCTHDRDPLEPYNRTVLQTNEVVDAVVVDPLASAYRTFVPEFARDGLHEILENLRRPGYAVQHLLRGDLAASGTSLAAFGIDATLGLAGLQRPAAGMGIEDRPARFADTLTGWGVADGPFVVLPLLGPSTARGATGRVIDAVADPTRYAMSGGARTGYVAARVINRQERSLDRRREAPPEQSTYEALRARFLDAPPRR